MVIATPPPRTSWFKVSTWVCSPPSIVYGVTVSTVTPPVTPSRAPARPRRLSDKRLEDTNDPTGRLTGPPHDPHPIWPSPPQSNVAPIDLSKVSNVFTPVEAFEQLVQKGEYNANSPPERLLFSSALGGCYVGMGAMVSLAVAGNSAGIAAADPGLQKFIFAALFPMNLLLAQQVRGK